VDLGEVITKPVVVDEGKYQNAHITEMSCNLRAIVVIVCHYSTGIKFYSYYRNNGVFRNSRRVSHPGHQSNLYTDKKTSCQLSNHSAGGHANPGGGSRRVGCSSLLPCSRSYRRRLSHS
jgi:hypothetical protein